MIVEAHSHIDLELPGVEQRTSHAYGAQIEGVAQYLRSYAENGVDACWVFGNRSWRDSALTCLENDALSRLGREYVNRLFPWGSVNPDWPERQLRAEIRRMAGELALCGIKLVPIIQGVAISSAGMDVLAEEAES